MEIRSAGVVPEPVPSLSDRAGTSARQVAHGGEAGEEARIVLQHPAHLRLLQHEFAHHDPVGIAGAAPRQVAGGASVPGEELAAKLRPRGGLRGHAPTRYNDAQRTELRISDFGLRIGRASVESAIRNPQSAIVVPVNGVPVALDLRRYVGRWSLRTAGHAGRFSFLLLDMVRGLAEWRIWLPRMVEQAVNTGYGSLFIVLLVSGFAGAVTSLQTGYQFTGQLPLYVAGGVIVESMILELGPVLSGLILAGRIGARYAAELGTMRVTEQIDALESLGRSPVTHLLLPRILAGLIAIPALVMLANAFGIVVGFITAKSSLGLTYADFEFGARYFFRPLDLWYSLVKSYAFAGAVTIIPCYIGFNTQQGAEGVGRSTTQAVVASSVTVLMLDTILTKIILGTAK